MDSSSQNTEQPTKSPPQRSGDSSGEIQRLEEPQVDPQTTPQQQEDSLADEPRAVNRRDDVTATTLGNFAKQSPLVDEPPTVISNKQDLSDADQRSLARQQSVLGSNLVGETLGHFQLDAFVGAGGMGAVFRGHDTMLDRQVAVKVLSQEHNAKGDTVRRFKNEAQSAARLDHPNIARVYFVGEDKGWNYIVFEFINGTNIRDLVDSEGPLSLEQSLSILIQVAEALEHASQREVVHRDIKPSNILTDSEMRAKLVDMGLARLHQVNSENSDLTASGMTLGTFDYISPEQARDPRLADVRSDLYSLGCTLFFMLTGRPPFPEGTVLQKLLSHSGEEPPDPREFRPEIPDEVVAVVKRLMAKSPAQRYQQPSELIGATLLVIEELGLTVPRISGTVWVAPSETRTAPIERHLPWAVPVITLLIVVFVLDMIWSARDDSFFSEPLYSVEAQRLADVDAEADLSNAARPPANSGVVPIQDPNPRSTERPETNRTTTPAMDPQSPTENGRVVPAVEGPLPAPLPRPMESLELPPIVPSLTDAPREGTSANGPTANGTAGGEAATNGDPPRSAPSRSPPTSPDRGSTGNGVGIGKGSAATISTANVIVVPKQSRALDDAIVRAAADDTIDTIELHYDGPSYESPLLLDGEGPLTIKAGRGFNPTIAFAPQENDPVERMMMISGGNVTFEGVDLWMDIPRDTRTDWTLISLDRTERLILKNSVVTVHQPLGMLGTVNAERVAIVRLPPRPSGTSSTSTTTVPRSSGISLENCVIRGEAGLLRAGGDGPFRVQCQSSLISVTGHLLEMRGQHPEASGTGATLEITRSTIDTGGGLAYLAGSGLVSLRISLNESILAWQPPQAMLTQISSSESIDAMMGMIRFTGDRNCYQLAEPMHLLWRVEQRDQLGTSVRMDFPRWAKQWDEKFSDVSEEVWLTPIDPDKPHSNRLPADYTLLDDSFKNPAYRPSQRNAGADLEALPRVENRSPPASTLLPQIP
ncbi:MAG: protein kinase [Pirellulaceae bacterium]